MTSDDTPETLLSAVRDQAFKYVHKPVEPAALLETVRDALAAPDTPPIEVISARPEWVELVVPCTREAAGAHSKRSWRTSTPTSRRTCATRIGYAFRELLTECHRVGRQARSRRERCGSPACARSGC